MARTSGGLIKRNFQFTDQQIERIATMAHERDVKQAAAVRELIDLGWKVYERRKAAAGTIEDLVIEAVSKSESAA